MLRGVDDGISGVDDGIAGGEGSITAVNSEGWSTASSKLSNFLLLTSVSDADPFRFGAALSVLDAMSVDDVARTVGGAEG